jgi:hypothetical protein
VSGDSGLLSLLLAELAKNLFRSASKRDGGFELAAIQIELHGDVKLSDRDFSFSPTDGVQSASSLLQQALASGRTAGRSCPIN